MSTIDHETATAHVEISTDGLACAAPGLERHLAAEIQRGVESILLHVTRRDNHWLGSALRAAQRCGKGSRYVDSMTDLDDLREFREEMETAGVTGVLVLAEVSKMSPPVREEVLRLRAHAQVSAVIELRGV